MTTKLTGTRCQCASCGLLFNSTTAFDSHRAGSFSQRRCLTSEELHALGYEPNAAGFMRIPADEAQLARFKSIKSKEHTPCQ
jgi:hypothetical protein